MLPASPFLFDGAMGTELIARGLKMGECSSLWVLTQPEDVLAVHLAYAKAGVDAITTNTFSSNPIALRRFDLEHRMTELNRAAVSLARQAAGDRWVVGDIGPCGEFLDPFGDVEEEELAASVRAQVAVLAEAGVDAFVVETMVDAHESAVAVREAVATGLPVFATFAFEITPSGPMTMMGQAPETCVAAAREAGASAVGANCGTSLSLEDYLRLGHRLLEAAGDLPVLLQPNAGTPLTSTNGESIYDVSPEAFAAWGSLAIDAGVQALGGCCGTSPAHLAALRRCLVDR